MLKGILAYRAGETPNVPDSLAKDWIARGFAMQDKSMDEATETKAASPDISQEIKPTTKHIARKVK